MCFGNNERITRQEFDELFGYDRNEYKIGCGRCTHGGLGRDCEFILSMVTPGESVYVNPFYKCSHYTPGEAKNE